MTREEMTLADKRAPLMIGFDVPDLDGIGPADLAALERIFDRLALYCERKRKAMELRAQGDIPAALDYEAHADKTYDLLPKWARW